MQEWSAARANNASILAAALAPFSGSGGAISLPQTKCASCLSCDATSSCIDAHYKFYAHINPEKLKAGWTRDRIVSEINALGVPCYHGGSTEVYLEKAFDGTGWRPEPRLPNAKLLGETSFMMLVHPTLTAEEMDKSAAAIKGVFSVAVEPRH
jgi:dTDP-4-amino-4,6-dideoxygalactose transaminase